MCGESIAPSKEQTASAPVAFYVYCTTSEGPPKFQPASGTSSRHGRCNNAGLKPRPILAQHTAPYLHLHQKQRSGCNRDTPLGPELGPKVT